MLFSSLSSSPMFSLLPFFLVKLNKQIEIWCKPTEMTLLVVNVKISQNISYQSKAYKKTSTFSFAFLKYFTHKYLFQTKHTSILIFNIYVNLKSRMPSYFLAVFLPFFLPSELLTTGALSTGFSYQSKVAGGGRNWR